MPNITTPGQYDVKVVSIEFGETPNTGTPYLGLKFETSGGEHAYRNLWLSEKALEHTYKTLSEVFAFDGDYATVEKQLVGKECRITIDTEVGDDGKERLVVQWINRQRNVVPIKDKAQFLNSLTAKCAKFGSKATPKAFTEDDVPF